VYSKFRVGAAVLLDDGHIISGNNQENVAFPSGLCAERTVLFYTHANFPDKKIKAIAIYSPDAKYLLTPCGACRQVMIEYENIQNEPIQTIIISEKEIYVLESVKDWLPFEFSENLLK
jgi:cytidine deaminase